MASSNLIHDSSPAGKDIQFKFSTVQDGQPLDFENFPAFQFDVFDGSAGGRFDQDGESLITNIASVADPDLVGIYPEEQVVTVTVPWDKDPETDGGAARGILQYNPDFAGEIYVYLTINVPEGVAVKSYRNLDFKPVDHTPAATYSLISRDIRRAKLKAKGIVLPPPGDEECYGIIDTGPGDPLDCMTANYMMSIKPIRGDYISGCPSPPAGPMRSSVTFEVYWNCVPMCRENQDDTPGAKIAVIPYVVRAWRPFGGGPPHPLCPPPDWTPPNWIASGYIAVQSCYREGPKDDPGPILPQTVIIAPQSCDGTSCSPGIPTFNFYSRVKIDFGVPCTTWNNCANGSCLEEVLCERECGCPILIPAALDPCPTDENKWQVPKTPYCCNGCEELPRFGGCQVMYKGFRSKCNANCVEPTWLDVCDQDLYKVYWSPESDILTCGIQFNFWLRTSDIE